MAEDLVARNRVLEDELELLRGVLTLVKEDLNVKNDQIDHLYHTFLASREHKRREQKQREQELKQQVDRLEIEIRAKDVSYQRMHRSLQSTQQVFREQRKEAGATQSSQFHELPAVLVAQVMSYLDCCSVINAASMHRNWYVMVMCDAFWANLYLLRWAASDARQERSRVSMFASKYLPRTLTMELEEEKACEGTVQHSRSNLKYQDDVKWLNLYRERHVVEGNWKSGKAVITTLSGHTGTVTCLQFNQNQLVSGSDDGSMMLWSLSPRDEGNETDALLSPGRSLMQQHHRQQRSVEKLHSFYGHGGPVWALHFEGSNLFSGSYDNTVKIWDLQSGKCQGTLRGHTGWISSLDARDELLVSAGWDSSIKIWNTRTGVVLRTFQDAPANPIYALKVRIVHFTRDWDHDTNTFIAGCRRFGVQVWDVESGRKLTQFLGDDAKSQVNTIKVNQERVIAGGSDHTVKIWDRRQSATSTTLVGHKGAVMCVDQDYNHGVISGSYDSVIKLWDLRHTTNAVTSLEAHSSAVFSLQMDAAKLISGSADTTIKIFNFR